MEEKKKVGRPRTGQERKAPITGMVDPALFEWASRQPGGISATVRRALEVLQKQESGAA